MGWRIAKEVKERQARSIQIEQIKGWTKLALGSLKCNVAALFSNSRNKGDIGCVFGIIKGNLSLPRWNGTHNSSLLDADTSHTELLMNPLK
jgi:hypothetical protein